MLNHLMTSLGGIADFVNGDRGSNYPSTDDFIDDGIPFISAADIAEGGIDLNRSKRISREAYERLRNGKTQLGDVLFCLRGSLGKAGRVVSVSEAAIASSLVIVRAKQSTDPRYLYYVLQGPAVQGLMGALDNGSVQPNLSVREISKIAVPDLKTSEQRAIAHILGALDDKIELNRRMNETLEAMARALFKSWFVDFDPVRAKAEGRDTGLPREIADLFPVTFEDSELGEVPKGWGVVPVGELADVVGGSTPSTKEAAYWDGGRHCWATPKDLSNLAMPVLLGTERLITDAAVNLISSGLLPIGTVLLSSRAPIGYLAIAEVPVAINQGFIAMKPRQGVSNLFLLLWASWAHEEILSRANGSTFLEISKSNFRPIPVVSPPSAVFNSFDRMARPFYERIVANERESRTLAVLRDTLLPKLLSGEARVNDEDMLVRSVT